MEQKPINILDGSKEKREKVMKEFFGLQPEQTFQDLDVDIDDEDDIDE